MKYVSVEESTKLCAIMKHISFY